LERLRFAAPLPHPKNFFFAEIGGSPRHAAKEALGRENRGTHNLVQIVLPAGVARWYNFKPKITIWVNFGRTYNGR
jgi:hypothetical protein